MFFALLEPFFASRRITTPLPLRSRASLFGVRVNLSIKKLHFYLESIKKKIPFDNEREKKFILKK